MSRTRAKASVSKRKRTDSDDELSHPSSDGSEAYKPPKESSRRVSKGGSKTRPVKKSKGKKTEENDSTLLEDVPPHPASRHVMNQDCLPSLREALLAWYDTVHGVRGMPWRKAFNATFDAEQKAQRAYEVWISEIMLQQTQVGTVIPYYNKWMAEFPTIRALAASDIDTVNGIWKGLGYYSRAARLLAGAKKAVDEFDGRLPDNAKDLQAHIPGIGRYSAGAISSIAYNECAPVLDGNVNRLMSRVLALHANPKAKSTLDLLWAGAEAVVTKTSRPGDLNQALIELGSTICKPRDADCGICPLKAHCEAYGETRTLAHATPDVTDIEDLCEVCEPPIVADTGVTRYPMKIERKKAREETDVVSVVEWSSAALPEERWFILVRRPDQGLLAGLYEFPTVPDVDKNTSAATARKKGSERLRSILADPFSEEDKASSRSQAKATLLIESVRPAGDVLHIFSHIRKTYRVQLVTLCGGGDDVSSTPPILKDPACKWVRKDDLAHSNIGTGVTKIWKKANEGMD